jgi:MBG domain (YGX type)
LLADLTASHSGFVNGDTSANLTTLPTVTTPATAGSPVAGSPYAITASGAVDSDYSFTYIAGSLTVIAVPLTITADLGFQSPYVGVGTSGAYQIDPTGSARTFTGSAGLAGNGSAFTSGNPSAPVGTQVGVIQQAGQISQTIDLPAGVYSPFESLRPGQLTGP